LRPAGSVNYRRGLPRAEAKGRVGTPTVILALLPEESKGQDDVPFLFRGMRESRKVRAHADSAVQMPAVRQAVL